ncbi:MAG: hypothetical protein Q7T28_13435 [Cypionkella sp.]|uniref:hypothetical protein n=1 Tax=Cypionkella sp. TaxID=2811411 RepID=UPI002723046F|nr:hypothetical protein [Cypionkella sp.]MDO8327923.1 hypothetical protein [Cypionkella sp.]
MRQQGRGAAALAVLLGLAPVTLTPVAGMACALDAALPQGWANLRGYARPGDDTAPAVGRMRAYRVEDPALLQALHKLDGDGDITAAAAGQGVRPTGFIPPARAMEKQQQPNRIYRFGPAGQTGVFVAFVASDQPGAALAGQLFCQLGADGFASLSLGGIEPAALPGVVKAACQAVAALPRKCPAP